MAIKRGTSKGEPIIGTAAADQLFGLGGNDTLMGAAGNDTLDGGTGADKMSGGAGNDTYIVDNKGDKVTELANQGTDTVKSSITLLLGANVENLTLTGSAAINGTGNSLNNSLFGNAAANVLSGGLGNDVLSGGAGSDQLFGGDGNDMLTPGAGTDTVDGGVGTGDSVSYADSTAAVQLTLLGTHGVTVAGGAAGDTVSNVEGLIGSSFGDTLILNGAGTGFASFAYGGAGNDTISVAVGNVAGDTAIRVLRGDAGNDTLKGDQAAAGQGQSVNQHFWLQYDKGFDFITFFSTEDDLLVSAAEFNLPAGLAGQPLPASQFLSSTGQLATTEFHRLIFETDTNILWADKDGSGDAFASIPIANFSSIIVSTRRRPPCCTATG